MLGRHACAGGGGRSERDDWFVNARSFSANGNQYTGRFVFLPVNRDADHTVVSVATGVRRGDVEVELTGRETSLLTVLFQHLGDVVPKEDLLDHAWGADHAGSPKVVEVLVIPIEQHHDGDGEDREEAHDADGGDPGLRPQQVSRCGTLPRGAQWTGLRTRCR